MATKRKQSPKNLHTLLMVFFNVLFTDMSKVKAKMPFNFLAKFGNSGHCGTLESQSDKVEYTISLVFP